MTQRIDLPRFLIIAEVHSGIPAERLARMDRVVTLGQSAIAAPFAGYGEVDMFPAFHQKAAIYASRIVTYHPLPDGNKRTGYDVMAEFVEVNGGRFEHLSLADTAAHVEWLAGGALSEEDFVAWVQERLA